MEYNDVQECALKIEEKVQKKCRENHPTQAKNADSYRQGQTTKNENAEAFPLYVAFKYLAPRTTAKQQSGREQSVQPQDTQSGQGQSAKPRATQSDEEQSAQPQARQNSLTKVYPLPFTSISHIILYFFTL